MNLFEERKMMLLLLKDFVEFPQATMCKHYAAARVLSVMDEFGLLENWSLQADKLAKAIVEADDEEALKLL